MLKFIKTCIICYGSKHEITFGKNRKHEIGQSIRYDDINNSSLSSYDVIEKGLKEGKWFVVTEVDTTEEFKQDYSERKSKSDKEKATQFYKEILTNIIKQDTRISIKNRETLLKQIEGSSYEELESYVKKLFNK